MITDSNFLSAGYTKTKLVCFIHSFMYTSDGIILNFQIILLQIPLFIYQKLS